MVHTHAHTTQARACTRAHKRIDALIGCIHVYLCICRPRVCTNVLVKNLFVHVQVFEDINTLNMFMQVGVQWTGQYYSGQPQVSYVHTLAAQSEYAR
jgi:hypothetical protein